MTTHFRNDYRHLAIPSLTEVTPTSDSLYASDPYDPPITDLTNPIHPLFSPLNFPCADYPALRPALLLASRLIDTDALLPFFHAIFFGTEHEVWDDGWGCKTHWAYFRPRDAAALSARDRAITRYKLRAMSHMFKFHRAARALGGFDAVCRCTCRGAQQGHPMGLDAVCGVVEEIEYSEVLYQRMVELAMRPGALTMTEAQWRNFSFATLLVHELAHAAVSVAAGVEEDSIFEENVMSEDGYDWEDFVFGGVITNDDTDLSVIRCALKQWPSPSTAKRYLELDGHFWMSASTYEDVEVTWEMSDEFVEQMFSQAFWEEVVPREGASALRVAKKVGRRKRLLRDTGEWMPLSPAPDDADFFHGVPEGYWPDGDEVRLLESDHAIEHEGFGRLMRINIEALWGEELARSIERWPQSAPKSGEVCAEDVTWELPTGAAGW